MLGRMVSYTGQAIAWDDAVNSQQDLSPSSYSWDADPPVLRRLYPHQEVVNAVAPAVGGFPEQVLLRRHEAVAGHAFQVHGLTNSVTTEATDAFEVGRLTVNAAVFAALGKLTGQQRNGRMTAFGLHREPDRSPEYALYNQRWRAVQRPIDIGTQPQRPLQISIG